MGVGRLIPAWAGKTTLTTWPATGYPAHPRVGGENVFEKGIGYRIIGSSPRGRGKPIRARGNHEVARLIPAWAGKTLRSMLRSRLSTAHPRVGGENAADFDGTNGSVGSSPRGRGKLHAVGGELSRNGLIPAWAGKTPRYRRWRRPRTAHPRVGGENVISPFAIASRKGSSPRGRGKPERRGHHATQEVAHPRVGGENVHAPTSAPSGYWLIPAWAGKTGLDMTHPPLLTAHPRVGGENLPSQPVPLAEGGSSPRGRGKLQVEASGADRLRLIPAWAGKTVSTASLSTLRPAHPRVGGENFGDDDARWLEAGSSPRGRGKLEVRLLGRRGPGLIPAWAGKTTLGAHRIRRLSGSSPRGRGKRL